MFFKPHHVCLSVKDLNKSVNFYTHLGFKQAFFWSSEKKDVQIIHMKLNDFFLELFSYTNCKPAPESSHSLDTDLPRIGIKHFALQVDSLEDARQFFLNKKLAEDINITEGRTGIRYFFVKDPDGILLEIVEDRRVFTLSKL